jgi:hypothetical protein
MMGAAARCVIGALVLLAVTGTIASAAAADTLAAARDLYASAAYEDALAVLNRLRADGRPGEGRAIDQYRAFCLLALGRTAEAERAIEAVVTAEPSYHPSVTDVSPRVRTAFSDVRRRMLPNIIQQNYAQAKAAYDRKEFAGAADGFKKVLDAMTDPDLSAAVSQPPLADLRTLAVGFYELAAKAAAPPPLPATPSATAPGTPPAPHPMGPRVFSVEDASVTAPVTVVQTLPTYPARPVPAGQAVLEVVINEAGMVEMATMRSSINALYDKLAVASTKNWRYRPATLNGVPVKFRKNILISLSARE